MKNLILLMLIPILGISQRNLTGVITGPVNVDAGVYASDEDGRWVGATAGVYQGQAMYMEAHFTRSMNDIGERYRYGGEVGYISPNPNGFRGFGFLRLDHNWDKFTDTQQHGTENGLYDSYTFAKVGAGLTYVINPGCQVRCPGNNNPFITAPSVAFFYADNNAPNKWGYKPFYLEAGMDMSYSSFAMSIRYMVNLGANFRLTYYLLND